jgi:hypothetical protein
MLQALSTFAQDYTYYTMSDSSTDAGMGGLLVAYLVLAVVLGIPAVAGLWKMFEKAKEPGWAAVVPIYNIVVFLKVVGRPTWWIFFFVLAFIPFLGVVVSIVLGLILANDMAKSFGKAAGYTVLLFLVPFVGYPLLGFGKDKYQGPAALVSTAGSDGEATVKRDDKHKV